MTCFAPTAAHDLVNVHERVMRLGAWKRTADLCNGCADRLIESGMDVRTERRDWTTRPLVIGHLRLRIAA